MFKYRYRLFYFSQLMAQATTMNRQVSINPSADLADSYASTRRAFVDRALLWLARSERKTGGSAAFAAPLLGWSKAYPETTGYICSTLVEAVNRLQTTAPMELAQRFGHWLVSIQEPDGCWRGGKYPYATNAGPSVFNTGQILFGLVALARVDAAGPWNAAAAKAATWLANGVSADGEWAGGHYRGHQPAYYTHVAWPMLEYWAVTDEERVRTAAERVLARTAKALQPNGAIEGWSFTPNEPAFTHTIAYTLQGFLESARLTGASEWRDVALPGLERLRRAAELAHGRLPGAFSADWQANKTYECVTGSAQISSCFLLAFNADSDIRWVNAAAKLVDRVINAQADIWSLAPSGGIPGSSPLHGDYMRFRYPNWAAKFGIDAVFGLDDALAKLNG